MKKNYRYIFLDANNDEFKLVKTKFRLLSTNSKTGRIYYDYYDGKLFGNHIAESRTKNWVYIGLLSGRTQGTSTGKSE